MSTSRQRSDWPLKPPADRLLDALRDGEALASGRRPVEAALGGEQPTDLDGEERVPLGLRVDSRRQLVRRGPPVVSLDQLPGVVGTESPSETAGRAASRASSGSASASGWPGPTSVSR